MQNKNYRLASALLTTLLIFMTAVNVCATGRGLSASWQREQTVTVSEEFIKALDRATVELEGLRKIKKLTDQQVEEYKQKIDLLEKLQATQELAMTKQEQATAELDLSLQAEKDAVTKCKQVVADYVKELDRVRRQRDRAIKWGVIGTGTGLLVGFVLATLLGK